MNDTNSSRAWNGFLRKTNNIEGCFTVLNTRGNPFDTAGDVQQLSRSPVSPPLVVSPLRYVENIALLVPRSPKVSGCDFVTALFSLARVKHLDLFGMVGTFIIIVCPPSYLVVCSGGAGLLISCIRCCTIYLTIKKSVVSTFLQADVWHRI